MNFRFSYKQPFLWFCGLAFLILTSTGCTSVRQLRYFNDLPDSARINLPLMVQEERIIQKGDKLAISLAGESQEATAFFNQYGGIPTSGGMAGGAAMRQQTGGGQGSSEMGGFLVDINGDIEFPILGKIKADGLTSTRLADTLRTLVKPYLKNPITDVRFIELRFTVLGEVRSPGQKTLPYQRTTLLDALGSANDLPRSAKRYDIQVYRDYNGKREIFKLDLRNKDILTNPELFFVKHNDVIYVQPRDITLFREEAGVYISLVSGLIAFTTLIVTLAK